MVYVLDKDGTPIMPTERHGNVRRMLRDGEAKVVRRSPFTIQLTYEPETTITQPTTIGIDIGYTEVGVSVVTETKEIFSGNFRVRTDVQKRIADKSMYRNTRRGRKTRYRKARFLNRKKSYADAPSIRHKVESHIRIVNMLSKVMPLDEINIEIANFDPAKIKNPEIQNEDYAKGEQQGYENVKAYVRARDRHTCHYDTKKCSDKLEVHHIRFRSQGGSDAPNNLITLCSKCHKALHDGKLELNIKAHKSLRSATFMNTVSKRLQDLFPDAGYSYGYQTKSKRWELDIEKSHTNDAFVIAGGEEQNRCRSTEWLFKRRNNRQLGKLRKGFAPSSRKQRYKIQPKDIIEFEGKRYSAIGTHCKGKRVMILLNEKKKSVAVNKVKIIFHNRSILSVA